MNEVWPCCRCCGTNDPDYGTNTHAVRVCPANDRHRDPCVLCGQG